MARHIVAPSSQSKGRGNAMTRFVSGIALSMIALCGLAACQREAAPIDLNADAAAIALVEDSMRTAFATKDPLKLAGLYASDATLYVPGELRPRVGTKAIMEGAKKDFADPAFHRSFTTGRIKVDRSGQGGYSKGSFTVRYTDPKTKAAGGFSGYYLTLFARQLDGSWKVIEDMTQPAG
jgi:uncharacterized protein (TIGR02246 family)